MHIINIKNKKEALKALACFKGREQKGVEIKLVNVHLCKINKLTNNTIFSKNDLFVNGETLFDIMHPVGGYGRHNHHGLSEEMVLEVLNNAYQPIGLYMANSNRFVIATVVVNNTGENIILVIEKGAQLRNNRDANINKLITIYPRRNILEIIVHKKGKIIK